MRLVIDPSTPKGQIQLEAIKWSQDQMNKILEEYFNGKYRIQKGLRIHFDFMLDQRVSQDIKVSIDELAPQTVKRFKEAVEEALSQLDFPDKQEEAKEGEIVDAK